MENVKFMQSLNKSFYKQLEDEASRRGTNIQELLRNVIIPDWLKENSKK